jgi:hypothetical protein
MFSNLKKDKNDAKIYPSTEYIMNFDGACKGNPGLAGAGAVIYKNREEIWSEINNHLNMITPLWSQQSMWSNRWC